MVKEKAALALERGDGGWRSGIGNNVTVMSAVRSIEMSPRDEENERTRKYDKGINILKIPKLFNWFL